MNTKEALDALCIIERTIPRDNYAIRTIRTTLEAVQREDAAWEAVKPVEHPMQPEMVLMLSLDRGGSRTPHGFSAMDSRQSYAIVNSREQFVEKTAIVADLQADAQRLHREYNALVKAQRAGAENAADVIHLTDECAAKGIVLVPETHGAEEFVMRKIELWTEDGKPRYVATVEIAPFPDKGMPMVVMWGNRVFHLAPGYAQSTAEDASWKYQECFCVVSLTASPGLPKDD